MAKWVDEGETETLNILFGSNSTWSNVYLGLYLNSSEPGETANLTTGLGGEPSGGTYARIALTRGANWTVTGDNASYAQQTFNCTGANWGNVYGYFIGTTSNNTGKLLCVEQFSNGPYNVQDGGSVKITPKITCA